jgi:hypothetical protein
MWSGSRNTTPPRKTTSCLRSRCFTAGAAGLTVNGVNADYTPQPSSSLTRSPARHSTCMSCTRRRPAHRTFRCFCNLNRRDLCDVDLHQRMDRGRWVCRRDQAAERQLHYAPPTPARISPLSPCMADRPRTIGRARSAAAGAYRLTARYQLNATNAFDWKWYTSDGRRDHAVVVSPKKVHDLTMYEVNPLTVKATSDTSSGRSTFQNRLLEGNPDSFYQLQLGVSQ